MYPPNPPPDPVLRPATGADRDFLAAMLSEAANWRPGPASVAPGALDDDPRLRSYLTGWPRDDDLGVVALAAADGRPVGAAWCRTATTDGAGYGHVADDIPEVSIAVAAGERGRGIGTALLADLIRRAAARGDRALSLSVEHDNPAKRLYERVGFATVVDTGDAATMLLDLSARA